MKIICIGRNYAAHAKELGNEIPEEPIIFMKPKSALLQAHTPFYYPEFTNELHYEVELVLRICKNGKYIQERHASNYYNGITVGIDFTARDLQDEAKKIRAGGGGVWGQMAMPPQLQVTEADAKTLAEYIVTIK